MLKKVSSLAGFCLVFSVIFFSCAATPEVKEASSGIGTPTSGAPVGASNERSAPVEAPATAVVEAGPQVSGIPGDKPVEKPPEEVVSQVISPDIAPETYSMPVSVQAARPPVRPWKPAVPEYIMGKGLIHPEDLSAFLVGSNPRIEKEFVENLAFIYAEETAIEGVNHDVAFAQMCLETGFLRYGGLVTPDMNNFCGLGAIGPGQTGAWFPDPRTGVRAHIQHLKAYATEAPLKQELVDPRYHYVRYGSSPAIKGLAGTWAADLSYAEKINNILERIFNFVYED